MVGAWARAGGVLSQEVERGRLDPSAVGLQGCSQTSIPKASPWASWSVVSARACSSGARWPMEEASGRGVRGPSWAP